MASPAVPTRRLSQRRSSMVAPDPFMEHSAPAPVSSTSRITIVRVPSQPGSPALGPQEPVPERPKSRSEMSRRSSWGSNRSSSSAGGMAPGRMSFAFSSFTPIVPPSQAQASPASPPSVPPSPTHSTRSRRSMSGSSMAQIAPQRPSTLTPQQLVELAQQSINAPAAGTAESSSTVTAAPFTALPSEVYLPFINRPQEVTTLLTTPQTARLFALLASTFPQQQHHSRPPSAASYAPSNHSASSSGLALSDLPEDPKEWSLSHLVFWLKHVTRHEANDREWVAKIRICINNRSEVLWQRFAGALGVPAGFDEEEDESAILDDDEPEHHPAGVRFADAEEEAAPAASESAENPEENIEDLEEEAPCVVEPLFSSTMSPSMGLGLASPQLVLAGPTTVPPSTSSTALDEVAEEDESEAKDGAKTPEKASEETAAAQTDHSPSSSLHPRSKSRTGSIGRGSYAPHAPSPLVVSTNFRDESPGSGSGPSAHSRDSEVDFPTEVDPNAEPIQGLRITNAPIAYHHTGGSSGGGSSVLAPGMHRDHAFSLSPLDMTAPASPFHPHDPPAGAESSAVSTATPSMTPGSSYNSSKDIISEPSDLPPARRPSHSASRVPPGSPLRSGAHHAPYTATSSISYSTRSNAPPARRGSFGMMGGNALMSGPYYHMTAERGPGSPLFPSSFANLSLSPTLSANNPQLRNPQGPPASAYPPISSASGTSATGGASDVGMHYVPRLGGGGRRRPPSWADGWQHGENEYAVTIASGSSDRG